MTTSKDTFTVAGRKISSRLFIGTGKFPDKKIIPKVIRSSCCKVVTVALRRVDFKSKTENILKYIPKNTILMPNTSGARNAQEAVRIAHIARAAGCGDWIKIEVIPDSKYLLPDNTETIKATKILAKEGFKVFPYMMPDLISAKRLVDAGAKAIMPLGSPIGSNRGIKTKELVRMLIDEIKLPIIVDAGLGLPSHAAECMEMGCCAVLVNTAIATATNPIEMAKAFALAVDAGRLAYIHSSGQIFRDGRASSPLTGFLR
ncbi:MAG TPA: thiazole synthase [Elusimicrobiales bacterium]|nr:thiazole synthase [Elusimicrobiales bacterium]